MKIGLKFVATLFLLSLVLSACGPSQEAMIATTTQIAANIFFTLTAQAPTITPTFTPSPTATLTPTPTLTPTSTATDTPTATPTLGPSVLFFDDFSSSTTGFDEYEDADGSVKYQDGSLRIFVNIPDSYYWTSISQSYSDVIIDVDTQKAGGPDYNEFGVICRMEDDNNFYVFLIANDGGYAIYKQINGEWTLLSGTEWSYNTDVINYGDTPNHLMVTCNGENLKLNVNGTELVEVSDSDLATGDVGLYAGTYSVAGVDILFDNFTVTKP